MIQTYPSNINALESKLNRPQSLLSHLDKLVSMPSESKNSTGVNKVQGYVAELLKGLGFSVRLIESNSDSEPKTSGHLLVAEYASNHQRFINFVCHADTVFAESEVPHKLLVKGPNAYGPGIIDDKGGILVAYAGILEFLKSTEPNFGLRFICSPNEEIGSPGFHKYFKQFAKDSVVTLGFEPASEDGSVVVQRKGNLWYDVHVEGQKAHAGRHHHMATNACAELAMQFAKVQALTNYQENVTVNIGRLEGGTKHNVVSDRAFGQLDIRFPCFDTRNAIQAKIESYLDRPHLQTPCGTDRSSIAYQIVDDCPPLPLSEHNEALADRYCDYVKGLEQKAISKVKVGGAADCNHFCIDNSSVVIDGLGPKGVGMHTHEECIEIESLVTRPKALAKLLKHINFAGGLH